LAQDCNSASSCVSSHSTGGQTCTKGPNWVRYDNPAASLTATGTTSNGVYWYMPSAWMAQYSAYAGMNALIDGKYMVPQCMYSYETYEVMNRCIPKLSNDTFDQFCGSGGVCPDSSTYTEYMNSYGEVGGQALSDVFTTMWVIFGSFAIAIVIGFLWIWFMEECAGLIVWFVIICGIVMSLVITLAFAYGAFLLKDRVDSVPQLATHDTDEQNMYICIVFASIFGLVWLIITCMVVCYCKQIQQAIELIKLASAALMDFPYLIFYPAAQICGLLALFIVWSLGAALLASSGTQAEDLIYGTHSWAFSDDLQYMMWYWLFGLLWIGELMVACGTMIVSGCFAIWFFSKEVADKEKGSLSCCGGAPEPTRLIPSWVLCKSMKITWFNHMGTCMFGSLIMAIIDMIRIVVEYLDKKKEEMGDAAPWYWNYIFYCAKCCLWCLDKCMRFLNKNAYIQTVIKGTSLCPSACHAISVMFDELPLFLLVSGIQSGVFFLGKFSISVMTAGICGIIIDLAYVGEISSPVLPIFVCLIIGYAIANSFMTVYDMGIDTMLMCFAEAKNGNDDEACCASICGGGKTEGEPTLADRRKMNIPKDLQDLYDATSQTEAGEAANKKIADRKQARAESEKSTTPLSGADSKSAELEART